MFVLLGAVNTFLAVVVVSTGSSLKVDLRISLKTLGKEFLILSTISLSPRLKISCLIDSSSFEKSIVLLLIALILSWATNFNSKTLKCLLNKYNNTFLVKTYVDNTSTSNFE